MRGVWGRGKYIILQNNNNNMATKTAKGRLRKSLFDEGRESGKNWRERQTGQREQTKTKVKRQKKADEKILEFIDKS